MYMYIYIYIHMHMHIHPIWLFISKGLQQRAAFAVPAAYSR